MQRILILGCPGSGKSTLARELAERTGLPLVHLDQIYWRPGWVEPSKEEWHAQLPEILARPAWILDGNYGGSIALRLEAADTAILLDRPTWLCLFRIFRRSVLTWGRIRPDMAEGCSERFDLQFFAYVLNFRRAKLPKVMTGLRGFHGQHVVLRSNAEVEGFLRSSSAR
ncbi:AAA family ATPase [Terriglobus saanensis]|uniref:Shikimate kinase n=1 Tax=Terriglobus saanensis (strain ATCC BAA-1853 / DSM 23119 / SP1PR4) TaxID=401053 RepID=E8V4P6_TERSS|nr:AAA family ATPase [Terriglobus saanensis]ADV81450.1 shikimate kinase [Terriglobus saanensis SP1PR4]